MSSKIFGLSEYPDHAAGSDVGPEGGNPLVDVAGFVVALKKAAAGNAGMILVHNGVVRNCSRDGEPVAFIEIEVDRPRLVAILDEARRLPGVLAADAEIREGRLHVGEDIMLLGIAGDIRENVISALTLTLNRIKSEVTHKKEFRV